MTSFAAGGGASDTALNKQKQAEDCWKFLGKFTFLF